MKRFIRRKLPFILIAVQAVLILGILFYIVPGRYRLYNIVLYDAAENVPANPLTGYAPPAESMEDCAGTDLVFIRLPFSEWEPREGVFAVEALEEKYHVREHKAAGRHAVLRFVCDLPGDSEHRDIPDWLYERTGGGTVYDDDSGKGYSPAYGDDAFLAAHQEALRALADWCLQDGFVAYVEIGSVGPDGNWNPAGQSAAERIPSGSILRQFAQQYAELFPPQSGIRLLNSAGAERIAGGSWNDVLGEESAASKWIAESVDCAESAQARNGAGAAEKDAGSAEDESADRLWTREPVGGGMTDTIDMDDLLMASLSETLEQIRNCHLSFIGPACPDAAQQQTNGSEMILRNVGYCIYLSRLQTTVDFIDDELDLHFTFENIGRAPMYWDWPVTMYIYDPEGNCTLEQTLDLKLSDLLPDAELTVTGSIPYTKDLLKGFRVGISIRSPDGSQFITLAQKGVLPDREGIHKVYLSPRKY